MRRVASHLITLTQQRAGGNGRGVAVLLGTLSSSSSLPSFSLPQQRRWTRTGEQQQRPSAVNVDDFTLNDEVVAHHQAIGARWAALGAELQELKMVQEHEALLGAALRGLQLVDEVGVEDSPAQAVSMLQLEAAQALFNIGRYDDASQRAETALRELETPSGGTTSGSGLVYVDPAKVAEVKEFIGFIRIRQGRAKEATELFQDLLKWVDVGCRTAQPMVTVAAKAMRRTVLMGLGLSLEAQGSAIAASSSSSDKKGEFEGVALEESRSYYAQALERLTEALDSHIEEKDGVAVKDTLLAALRCFVGLGDVTQARETCRKYVSWCRRHGDDAGVETGEAELAKLEKEEGSTS